MSTDEINLWLTDGIDAALAGKNAVARELYCPVCENIPLDVCGTQACAQWRELIRQKLAAGWNEQQIKDYFVQQYGQRVLGAPPAKGINWLAYIVPPLVILGGIYILYHAFRTWKKPTHQVSGAPSEAGTAPETPNNQDEYVRKLEEQVRKQ